MTMVRPGTGGAQRRGGDGPTPAPAPTDPGAVERRRLERRRLVREEVLALVVLAAVLAATLVLLGMQWLSSGGPSPGHGGALGGAVSVSPMEVQW